MNIVLIGYRGTGKSTIGKILADKLKQPLLTMDDLIVKKAGLSVPEIVEKFGWDHFRDVESEVAVEVSNNDNCIIDCGGGVILREENVKNLKKNGKCFLLSADIDTIILRIQGDANRPTLKEGMTFREEQGNVLEERIAKYKAAADVVVDTSLLSVEEAAKKILDNL